MNSTILSSMIYSYMETAMIVAECFGWLYEKGRLDNDTLFSESDSETYEALVNIAASLEDENQRHDGEYDIEDLREKADKMILEAYGKHEEDKRQVRSYGIDIVVPDDSDTFNERNIYDIFEAYSLSNPQHKIIGAAWKASWTYDEYVKGGQPFSSN